VGYLYLTFNIVSVQSGRGTTEVCLVKKFTTIPCPSCGTTRAVVSLLHGDFVESFFINPFGIIVASIMLLAPLWVGFDFVTKQSTLFIFYNKLEVILKKPMIMFPLLFLVLVNWIWNIAKGL
jgi:hypothetical protein